VLSAPAYNLPSIPGVQPIEEPLLAERYFHHTFANGLTLLGEKMPGMQSAAMTLLLPAGSATDPIDRCGSATVLSDLVLRGAGSRDNRQLTDYLDSLGLQRSVSVGVHHTRFGCAAVADKVVEGLAAYADIIQRPHMPGSGFTASRDLALQALVGIDDEPRQKLLIKLREWHLPSPYGRNSMGRQRRPGKAHAGAVQDRPRPALSRIRRDSFRRGQHRLRGGQGEVEKQFGKWDGRAPDSVEIMPRRATSTSRSRRASRRTSASRIRRSRRRTRSTTSFRMAVEVLSGGMSGRLFTEVREKRGLCYSVWAGYRA
jgi:predicted Zn-dependent peptidase